MNTGIAPDAKWFTLCLPFFQYLFFTANLSFLFLVRFAAANLRYDEIKDIAQRYDTKILEWGDAAYNSTDISMLDLDETYSIGYTLRTLSAALWCY